MLIEQIKEEIDYILLCTSRPGIEKLTKYIAENGFYEAPCSGQYHLCKEGGLAEHSWNVYQIMKNLSVSLGMTQTIEHKDQIIITSLLHDLGKIGQFGKPNYVPNILVSGKQSDKKPYETNQDLLPIPHEIRSIQIASQFIELTEEENFAILHHNGMYGDLKYALSGKERPLQMLLHFADMWASRVVEKGE